MKKLVCAILALVLLVCAFPASAAGKKSLEVSLNGFGITYQLLMKALHQTPTVKREWGSSENVAQVILTDVSFLQVWTESKKDSAMIQEALHVATPTTSDERTTALCSMVATIYSFDPDLGIDAIVDLVIDTLPKKGEYLSKNCKYEYKESANIIMLAITPR